MLAHIALVFVHCEIGLLLAFISDLVWKMDPEKWLSKTLQFLFFPISSLIGIVGSGEVLGRQAAESVVGERWSVFVYAVVVMVSWPFRIWVTAIYVPGALLVILCSFVALKMYDAGCYLVNSLRGGERSK